MMNDKNNLAKLIVSGDKTNHEMAGIMLTNYTAVEFLEVLHEMANLYANSMPPNINLATGGLFLAPNLRVQFSIEDGLFFDLDFAVRKNEVTNPIAWTDIATLALDTFSFAYNYWDTQQANQVLGYLQQYYKKSQQ